eukprot:CAMPEP_0182556706 /NCGR_PEP_ID=MMETSP1324-20130603/885_1 /TAXON_ID=236786 /ORGANISM="Florenciella sp., Strain RCC1587" /LENGTH=78 /DNA_ID=CAMNT_0024768639 /DNA_START=302 /DNA_END=535 /DNA_ORIENTATION=-
MPPCHHAATPPHHHATTPPHHHAVTPSAGLLSSRLVSAADVSSWCVVHLCVHLCVHLGVHLEPCTQIWVWHERAIDGG